MLNNGGDNRHPSKDFPPKGMIWGFPGGAVESTCQCRGHGFEPWSREITHATEQLSPCATTTEAWASRARAPQQEKPPQ